MYQTEFLLNCAAGEFKRIGQLPFVPVAGLVIDVGDETPRTVESVCYWADTGYLSVILKPESGDSDKYVSGESFLEAHSWEPV